MLKNLFTGTVAAVALVLLTSANGYAATAQPVSNNVDNGLRVSPVRTDITIKPGQTQNVPVYITDETPNPDNLQVVINNFEAKGNSGIPALIFNSHNTYDPHGLKQFIAPIPNISLKPYKETFVNVKITIPKNNPGGGYYAAVRFAPANVTQSKNVTLSASVASLILVRVPGPGLKQQVSLSSFIVQNSGGAGRLFFASSGLQAVASFTNSGNVQEQPFGKVEVQTMGGKTIFSKQINIATPPGSVLPSSTRAFDVNLGNLGSFGRYKVSGFFGYGTNGQLLSASTIIYVVAPWVIITLIAVVVLIILAVIFMPKIFRAWYRRSLQKGKDKRAI